MTDYDSAQAFLGELKSLSRVHGMVYTDTENRAAVAFPRGSTVATSKAFGGEYG